MLVRALDLLLDAADELEARDHRPGPRVPGRPPWSGAPTASTPSRPPSGRSSRSGRCRCAATASGSPRARARHRGRQAVGRGRHVLQRRSRGRGLRVRALGLTPVPATQVLARDRHAELLYACASVGASVESFATRDPPPPAHRGARGRGAVPRRVAEGLERDAAQAQPGEVRAAQRSRPRAARQPAGRAGERRAVARARHLALVGRAHHPARLAAARVLRAGEVPQHRRGHARVPGADAGEPRRVVRARVQPAGAARAGRGGHDARRRVPRRAAQRDEHVGVSAVRSSTCCATTPTSSPRSATTASPRASTSAAALANVGRTFDGARRAVEPRAPVP